MEFQWVENGIWDIFIYIHTNDSKNNPQVKLESKMYNVRLHQEKVCHHSAECFSPYIHHTITLSAVSTGQLMERMAGWIAANCKSFLSFHIPQPLISTQL